MIGHEVAIAIGAVVGKSVVSTLTGIGFVRLSG
jgi:hypothetical protein